MLGNVTQWVEDCWARYGQGQPANGHPWSPENCEKRVIRGGAFWDSPWFARSASRDAFPPDQARIELGFRVARTLEP